MELVPIFFLGTYMPAIYPKYLLERDLVNDFCTNLVDGLNPWGSLNTSREFSYGKGRADVIATIFALERIVKNLPRGTISHILERLVRQ